MTSSSFSRFCVETLPIEANLRPVDGVLRVEAFRVSGDARRAADQLLEKARSEADSLLDAARQDAERAVHEAEQAAFTRLQDIVGKLENLNREFLERAEPLVVDLALALFNKLVSLTTPRERVEAVLRQILHEAPSKLVEPVLHVHPDDKDLLPELQWQIKPDPEMTPGSLKLEAAGGEWAGSFAAATAALAAVLPQ